MTWLLRLFLGLSDPAGNEQVIYLDREVCLAVEAATEAGDLTRAQLNDGRIVLIVKAECMGPAEAAEVTQ